MFQDEALHAECGVDLVAELRPSGDQRFFKLTKFRRAPSGVSGGRGNAGFPGALRRALAARAGSPVRPGRTCDLRVVGPRKPESQAVLEPRFDERDRRVLDCSSVTFLRLRVPLPESQSLATSFLKSSFLL